MANSMNKSEAVITGTGANSIIRGAKTMLSGHYSHKPLHVKICVQTGAPLHLIYSGSRGLKPGGKRVIMLKIASELLPRVGRPSPGITEGAGRRRVRPDSGRRLRRVQPKGSSFGQSCTSQSEVAGEIRQSA